MSGFSGKKIKINIFVRLREGGLSTFNSHNFSPGSLFPRELSNAFKVARAFEGFTAECSSRHIETQRRMPVVIAKPHFHFL